MLSLRVLSAIIGVPILITILYLNGFLLAGSLLVLVFLGILEFRRFILISGGQAMDLPVLLGSVILILGASNHWVSTLSLFCVLFLLLLQATIRFPHYSLMDVALNFLMVFYVGWTLHHLILLRNLGQGFLITLFFFFIIWSADTGAYCIGRFLGKTKLAPSISPNKTIEGAIGGLVLSVFVAIIFNYYYHLFAMPLVLVLAILLSIAGQIGDLFASALKRLVGVKDSGQMIPGHGGILDRFDSIIISAPVYYYLLILLARVG